MTTETRRPSSRPLPDGSSLAAIDLGSNSFHMIIARLDHGRVQVLDRLREPVRLAEGLGEDGTLAETARARALEALGRMGQRLRSFGTPQVRAVGTNTLRKADKAKDFRREAERALGHRIEVIPGSEEARLIYLGVSHGIAGAPARRLVIDIGGGSTECIIGDGFEPRVVHSLYMGCVNFSERFFGNGKLTKKRFKAAKVAAGLEVQPFAESIKALGWERVYGASGTIKAVAEILEANQWASHAITKDGLAHLRGHMIAAPSLADLVLPGLAEERRPVIAGGVAILGALFDDLGLDDMWVSPTALREGLLYDLLGRFQEEDPRDRTIAMLSKRYAIDEVQVARVTNIAIAMLDQVVDAWSLSNEEDEHRLRWACQLHELGLAINYSGHHKHAAYLIAESDLPGFSTDDKRFVASIVRAHRRKILPEHFVAVDDDERNTAIRLSLLLRLSVLFSRSRSTVSLPVPLCKANKNTLHLTIAGLDAHPLVQADLEQQQQYLSAVGYKLDFESA